MRFKCPKCQRRGHTLREAANGEFFCVCGYTEPFNFWAARFDHTPDEMSLREASVIIGAAQNGSTLRRAILTGKLQTRREGYRHLVSRAELENFYCYHFHRRANGHG